MSVQGSSSAGDARMEANNSSTAQAFIVDLGSALLRQGVPAHRVEATLSSISRVLGLSGQFFCVPTSIIASFGPGETPTTRLERVQPGGIDLARMVRLDALVAAMARGQVNLTEARQGLKAILMVPPAYAARWVGLAESVAAGCAVPFFGGGPKEALVAATIGVLLAALGAALNRHRASHLFAPIAATVAAAIAGVAPLVLGPVRVDVITVSGLIVLLPGLTLTTSVAEVATRNLVSGTARLTLALLTLLELGFGVALGSQIGSLVPVPVLAPISPPIWLEAGALMVTGASFVVLFQARLRDAHLLITGVVVAYVGSRVGAGWMGPELGAFTGALLVGIVSNLMSRIVDRPTQLSLVPGVLMLVPGSLGFSSINGMLHEDTIAAIDAAFHTGLVAIAIVVGLLTAPALVPPRRPL